MKLAGLSRVGPAVGPAVPLAHTHTRTHTHTHPVAALAVRGKTKRREPRS